MKLPEIRQIAPSETLHLRSQVLRPGTAVQESVFAGDDAPATQHWGAFLEGSLIAVASLYQEALPESVKQESLGAKSDAGEARSPWRLRGMAVKPDCQGQGIGRALLNECLTSVADHGGDLLWCNARTSAVPFYRAAGFDTVGGEFLISGVGPHYVMLRTVTELHGRTSSQ